MALKYAIKKTIFGFDKTKTERYVGRPVSAGMVEFAELCDQVTKVGMAPRGVVKLVIDGMIDAMILNMQNGMSVKLGEFGTIRPTFGCKSQTAADHVDAGTLRGRKYMFTPGKLLKNMIQNVSIQKYTAVETEGGSSSGGGSNPDGGGDGGFE